MRSTNHIEAEICWGHFHFLIRESFSIDVQELFVLSPEKTTMIVQTGQSSTRLRTRASGLENLAKLIKVPFGKKFDAPDIKLFDRVFRIFHWISSFFECPTFTCQQKFCHFCSGNIFHYNSVKNCFSIWIFCYNISTEPIDVVTSYMTLWVSLMVTFERQVWPGCGKVNLSWDWHIQHWELAHQSFANHLFQLPRLRYDHQTMVDWQCFQLLI